MAFHYGPKNNNSNLILYLDSGNKKSYPGEPTTNILYNPYICANGDLYYWYGYRYPTGTYDPNDGWYYDSTLNCLRLQKRTGSNSQVFVIPALTVANLTAGETYTLSADCLCNNSNAALLDVHTGTGGSWVKTYHSGSGNWERLILTFTVVSSSGGSIRLGLYTSNAYTDCWFKNVQLEQKSHATQFVNGLRNYISGWKDLSGNNIHMDLTDAKFDSSANMYFNGVDSKILYYPWPTALNSDNNTTPRSWEAWFKRTGDTGTHQTIFGHKATTGASYLANGGLMLFSNTIKFVWYDEPAVTYNFLGNIVAELNTWYHAVGVFDPSTLKPKLYVNGVFNAEFGTATDLTYSNGMNYCEIGYGSKNGGQHYFNGYIPIVKYYHNRALTASEILQNYEQTKGRFGL